MAAAIVKLAKFKYYDQLYDPMCGTGTIAIEAVMIGRNIAPGLLRRFDAEKWAVMHEPLWDEARQNAKAQIRPANFVVHAADIDPQAVQTAEQAAKMARIGSSICFSCADVRDFTAPDPKGVVVTNPPYGERLLEKKEAALLYTDMGKACLLYTSYADQLPDGAGDQIDQRTGRNNRIGVIDRHGSEKNQRKNQVEKEIGAAVMSEQIAE